jgi:hypothetical protein
LSENIAKGYEVKVPLMETQIFSSLPAATTFKKWRQVY